MLLNITKLIASIKLKQKNINTYKLGRWIGDSMAAMAMGKQSGSNSIIEL